MEIEDILICTFTVLLIVSVAILIIALSYFAYETLNGYQCATLVQDNLTIVTCK